MRTGHKQIGNMFCRKYGIQSTSCSIEVGRAVLPVQYHLYFPPSNCAPMRVSRSTKLFASHKLPSTDPSRARERTTWQGKSNTAQKGAQ